MNLLLVPTRRGGSGLGALGQSLAPMLGSLSPRIKLIASELQALGYTGFSYIPVFLGFYFFSTCL
jgi:hypothetical protein